VTAPADVPPVVTDLPVRLGELAPVFQRRRIAAGVDAGGRLVLVRPDRIDVQYDSDEERRTANDLVGELDADSTETDEMGVLSVALNTTSTDIAGEDRWPLATINRSLSLFRSRGIVASPNHIVFGAHSSVPALLGGASSDTPLRGAAAKIFRTPEDRSVVLTTAEPTAAPAFLREPLDLPGRRRPKVLVLDTGLRTSRSHPEHADLRTSSLGRPLNVRVHDEWRSDPRVGARDDEDEPDDDSTGTLDFEAGHGTFITGIVRQICPDAEVFPAGVLSSFGEGDTRRVRRTLRRMTGRCGPFDIVVMSFGAHFADDEAGPFGKSLLSLLGDAVAVAAAGNLRTCRPYFPAAVPGVVGVGALESGGRAWFSNFGPWVDACAPALNVVSTFFDDFTETVANRRRYRQWARWSGTSFAAPKVAGAIAQEMYRNQISAREAWTRLSSPKHLRVPDLGVVFNV
jgi:Subtilase family